METNAYQVTDNSVVETYSQRTLSHTRFHLRTSDEYSILLSVYSIMQVMLHELGLFVDVVDDTNRFAKCFDLEALWDVVFIMMLVLSACVGRAYPWALPYSPPPYCSSHLRCTRSRSIHRHTTPSLAPRQRIVLVETLMPKHKALKRTTSWMT